MGNYSGFWNLNGDMNSLNYSFAADEANKKSIANFFWDFWMTY